MGLVLTVVEQRGAARDLSRCRVGTAHRAVYKSRVTRVWRTSRA